MMRRLILSVLLLLQPAAVTAATTEPSLLGSSLKMVVALGIVIGLLLLLYGASRKGFGLLPQKKTGLIQVLETRPLGGRKFLCVVKVRNEEMLLGFSNDRIEYLSKISTGDNFSATLQQAQEEQS